ncbi:acyl-CoA thioester hydrolase/BAAT C-terminal domain-containing protein [Nocardioides sp. InS609-2]|uniref:acyl-CoA thioester hydrolase/BAAT C-terminal domain-containing protein n=1 Tax=Nocardioides sp. InS609-2 TaxID=2760705 RepID=UPI0020BDFFBE|nr:acyl-CoA thioester hydrolase/BAAT C-terminal domain-containing protein [Nocardioides sp. InS609-2]
MHVLAIRWFGGPGQQAGPYDVPIELFSEALDHLAAETDRLAVMGTSFGAEAALLTAARDQRVRATVAFAPSSVVWGGYDGTRWTSHWTADGQPVPWMPFVEGWESAQDPPAYRDLYAHSLAADVQAADEAAIPVERIAGAVVLVAGGDDQVWPSVAFAERIAARRGERGLETTVVTHPGAGHRTVLPGEPSLRAAGARMRRGGTPEAEAALGSLAWPHLVAALGLSTR